MANNVRNKRKTPLNATATSTPLPESPLKTPVSKSRKILDNDEIAQSIIVQLTEVINKRADGLQAGIESVKELVEFVFAEVKDLKGKMEDTNNRVETKTGRTGH